MNIYIQTNNPDLRMVGVGVTKNIRVDLVNLKSKNNLINLLTRIISSIKLLSDINKVEILLIIGDKVFY